MVLEGSVRHAGSMLRLTAQLINVADGFHLWSERYDREMTDVFAIQDEVARAIAARLQLQLAGGPEAPLVRRGTDNLDAYHLYLKGRHFWHQRGPGLQKAIAKFEQAIEADSHYALPYTGLADALCILGAYGYVPSQVAFSKARQAAERAVSLDDHLAEGHHSLGMVEYYFGWDPAVMEREFRRAIALNPNSAFSHAWLSGVLGPFGRVQEACAEAQRALELEPLSTTVHAIVGHAMLLMRRYDEAARVCAKALEIDPGSVPLLWVLGVSLLQQSQHEAGIAALKQAVALSKGSPVMLQLLGGALAQTGQVDEANRVLVELKERSATAYVPAVALAYIYLHLGQLDEAFRELDRAVSDRNCVLWWLAAWPGFEEVHQDPRYRAFLAGIGLESVSGLWA